MSLFLHRNGILDAGGTAPFTTEWKSAGTGATEGGGDQAWSNPGNITASDDNRASCSTGGYSAFTSDILRATNFGFTTGDIPAGATILGIEVGIEKSDNAASAGLLDVTVRLRTSGGQTGDNKADTMNDFDGTSDHEVVYGSAADTWASGLTDADIRGSDFGVDYQAEASDGYSGNGPAVDHIRIRVHGEA